MSKKDKEVTKIIMEFVGYEHSKIDAAESEIKNWLSVLNQYKAGDVEIEIKGGKGPVESYDHWCESKSNFITFYRGR